MGPDVLRAQSRFSSAALGASGGAKAQQDIANGNRWVVDLDLEKFFDRVNHDRLMAAVAAAVVVFLLSAGLYWFILREHETRRVAIEVSDCLAAVIAGILVFRLLQYERDRRRQLRQRLEVISEMNHHVRNALQVISLSAYSYADQQQLATVKESVERIQWALKEILPKL